MIFIVNEILLLPREKAEAGTVALFDPGAIDKETLKPTGYIYTVPSNKNR